MTTVHSIVSHDPEDLEDRINAFIDGKKVIHIAYLLRPMSDRIMSGLTAEFYAFIHYDDADE